MTGEEKEFRDQLVRLLEENSPELDLKLEDDTSLFGSGFLDSMGLFSLTLWIEKEIGTEIDLTTFDPSEEWDTVTDILAFIGKYRA